MRYQIYKCDTCLKTTELQQNNEHAFYDRCTLTKGCSGRLRYVSSSDESSKQITPLSSGQNFTVGNTSTKFYTPEYVNMTCGSSNTLVLAVLGNTFSNSDSITLTFSNELNQQQNFSQFLFNFQVPLTVISGKDSQNNILKIGSSDTVTVIINGKTADPSSYTISNNVISFNSPITYSTYKSSSVYVKILVYSAITISYTSLIFHRHVAGLSAENAWGNVSKISHQGQEYSLFYCNNLNALTLKQRYVISSVKVNGVDDVTITCFLLLSMEPYGPQDRVVGKIVPASKVASGNYVSYTVTNNKNTLLLTSSAMSDTFPPIAPTTVFYQAYEQDTVGDVADADVSQNFNLNRGNTFLLGPL